MSYEKFVLKYMGSLSSKVIWGSDCEMGGSTPLEDGPGFHVSVSLELGAALPRRETQGSCGYDLTSFEDYNLEPCETKLINTGVRLAVPTHLCAVIHGRSSLGKMGIATNTGIIDQDYRGLLKVSLRNCSGYTYNVKKGERIAQLMFHVIATPVLDQVASLDDTERGEGGFGSTGKGHEDNGGSNSTSIPVAETVDMKDYTSGEGV